jgi:hypothetical protein
MPVVSDYAKGLHDVMPEELRQLLLPIASQILRAADTKERAEFIAVQTVKRILPLNLAAAGLPDEAARCAAVSTLQDAAAAADAVSAAAHAADRAAYYAVYAAASAAHAAEAADLFAGGGPCAAAAAAAAAAHVGARAIFMIAVEILDGAIRLGANDFQNMVMAGCDR